MSIAEIREILGVDVVQEKPRKRSIWLRDVEELMDLLLGVWNAIGDAPQAIGVSKNGIRLELKQTHTQEKDNFDQYLIVMRILRQDELTGQDMSETEKVRIIDNMTYTFK